PYGCSKDENFSEIYRNLRYSVIESKFMVVYKLLYLTIYVGNSSYTLVTYLDKFGNLVMNMQQGVLDYTITKTDVERIIEILNKNGAEKI
ncbi:MAG: hypothetical protein K2J35_02925, partial [Eubacterium sp.]|nr:hypothetical protein [Eubacterium sp.]